MCLFIQTPIFGPGEDLQFQHARHSTVRCAFNRRLTISGRKSRVPEVLMVQGLLWIGVWGLGQGLHVGVLTP